MSSISSNHPIRLGVCGLGRGFMLMLPTLLHDSRIQLLAAADPRGDARQRFTEELGGRVFASLAELYAEADIEAIYLATPHELHTEQAMAVAATGKGLLLEKPMALTVADCRRISAAMAAAGTACVIGPSHSFDEPYQQAAQMIASGEFGALRHIAASNYTNFARRPRRAEEMRAAAGGAVLNQGVHQVDVTRLLAASEVLRVQATVGCWGPHESFIGAYSALLEFASGATASLQYNGYGHYDSARDFNGIGELGQSLGLAAPPGSSRAARTFGPLGIADAEAAPTSANHHEHFGSFVIHCDQAQLRPHPDGVMVYQDGDVQCYPAVPADGRRTNVIDELYAALRCGVAPRRGPQWGTATVAVCEAILIAAARRESVVLTTDAEV